MTRVPQVWCLYKEVQDYYEAGMRVPDDVTLLWCDDNWGNLRRLPTAAERARGGGAGIYYHFDYHGGPRSYQWINTNPLPKIWDQMSLATAVRRRPDLDRERRPLQGLRAAARVFPRPGLGPGPVDQRQPGRLHAAVGRARVRRRSPPARSRTILERYAKYNGRRKPELLAPDTYSLVNYQEAETVVADFQALAARAEAIRRALPAERATPSTNSCCFPPRPARW